MKSTRLPIFSLLLTLCPCLSSRADFQSGQSADMILGGVKAAGLLFASDIAVDPVTQKVFVADEGRHRVLRFSSQASLENGGLAEAVFGAADMFEQTAGTSATQLSGPQGICVDSGGRLWVADTGNHRVLRFNNAVTTASGAAASVVLGQSNFTTATAAMQVNRMNLPQDVEVDAEGRLWVADTGNHRVIRFDNAVSRGNGVNADGVLGQTTFTAYQTDINDTILDSPMGLAAEISGGVTVRLWVTDWYRSRVLAWNSPGTKANGAPANKLLGQPSFDSPVAGISQSRMHKPTKLAMEDGRLWVADTENHRVLQFASAGSKPIGGNADGVLGADNFTGNYMESTINHLLNPRAVAISGGRLWIGDNGFRVVRHDNAPAKGDGTDADGVLGKNSLAALSIYGAGDVLVESFTGKLFVSDSAGNRVLRYPSARSLQEASAPEAVPGQPDFTTITGGATASKMNGPGALAFDALGNLWVVDGRNHRVLRFANANTIPTGTAAVQVLGQSTFTATGSSLSASRFNTPSGLITEWGWNASFQTVVRRLRVSDRNNNRVLRFDSPLSLGNGASASGVLGAANLTTAGTGTLTASGLKYPGALTVDINGRLWVADTGNDRVLRFDSAAAKANNGTADGVLLQTNFTTNNAATGATVTGLSLGGVNAHRLFVTRIDRNDLAWYDNAATKSGNVTPDGVFSGTRIYATPGSTRAAVDPFTGRLWVGSGTTVMRFSPSLQSQITGYGFNAQNRFTLTITGTPGDTYEIRSSTDLLNWNTIERSDTMASGGVMNWTASAPPSGPKKFYRLQVP